MDFITVACGKSSGARLVKARSKIDLRWPDLSVSSFESEVDQVVHQLWEHLAFSYKCLKGALRDVHAAIRVLLSNVACYR
jgi:hypothetical protein